MNKLEFEKQDVGMVFITNIKHKKKKICFAIDDTEANILVRLPGIMSFDEVKKYVVKWIMDNRKILQKEVLNFKTDKEFVFGNMKTIFEKNFIAYEASVFVRED